MRSSLFYQDVKHRLSDLMDVLFAHIPAGVGKDGRHVSIPAIPGNFRGSISKQ